MKALELTNQKFGRLTVKGPEKRGRRIGWICSCSCGGEVWEYGFALRGGNRKSCGCIEKEAGDITGRRFGKLVAIKKISRQGKKRYWLWLCQCDCGKTKEAWTKNLYRGATKDCGCGTAERRRLACDPRRLSDEQMAINAKLSYYKSNAKHLGREFSLSKEEAGRLFMSDCFYCGRTASIDQLNGIDRAENAIGYTTANSIPSCSSCNYLKNDWSRDEIMNWVSRVYKRHFY